MAKFPEVKWTSADPGEFTETVEFAVLCCGNIEANNNKYYCLEIQKSKDGRYQLFCTRGRICSNPVYGVRSKINGCDITNEYEIKKEFDSLVRKKIKGKKGGEVSQYHKVETHKPTVGSTNILNISSVKVTSSVVIKDKINTLFSGKDEQRIMRIAYDENIHSIQTTTSIAVTSTGGLETELGPVTPDHIAEARTVLERLQTLQKKNQLVFGSRYAKELNNRYLSMIPRKMGRRIQEKDMILSDEKLISEFDLLEQLEAAVQVTTKSTSVDNDAKPFNLGFKLVLNPTDLKRVFLDFEKSRASNHYSLRNWKVANVFDVVIDKDTPRYETSSYNGPEYTLWHGSRNCNILSIMINGLIIPPHNAPHVTGRMFGNGIYGAPNSTKALNYSTGFWGGKNKYDSVFLFIVKFKMGRIYSPTSRCYKGPPKGYNSIYAKKSDGFLYNDECIVYNLDQQKVVSLVELKQK